MQTIVYINPDFYTDTDITVLRNLKKQYRVVWFYVYELFNSNTMRYGEDFVKEYGRKYGIETRIYYLKEHGRNPLIYGFYSKIAKDANSYSPDLVYHCIRNPFWGMAIKTTLRCKNVVMGIHDAQAHSYTLSVTSILNKLFRDVTLKFHKHFITFSPNQHELLKTNYGIDSAMVGMSYKDFGKSNKNVHPLSEGVELLFFGGIQHYKGLDILISAIEELKSEKNINNIHLTIAGKGSHWDECKSRIKTPELYNLMVRFIDNSEIPDLMSSSHFLVLPYRDATQSGPLVTAIAYELPIIAPDYGCFRESYNSSSAIFYKSEELKKALNRVAKMTQQEYDEMKSACKSIKDMNGEVAIAANYIQYFKTLI